MNIVSFTFNPFQENTYVIYDDTRECAIIDPGCYTPAEQKRLSDFITSRQLKVVKLLNTHAHLDHVFGNKYVAETYNVGVEIHRGELIILQNVSAVAQRYGLPPCEPSPEPSVFLEPGQTISFGNTELDIFFTPGHSPASLCFYNKKDQILIAGDVLFERSIGRTDLPGGNYETLMQSIVTQLLPLPDEVKVYPGHGEPTSIGAERYNNPFIREYLG